MLLSRLNITILDQGVPLRLSLGNPDPENPDSVGTFQQQVRLEPAVRPEKSGISTEFPSRRNHKLTSCHDI